MADLQVWNPLRTTVALFMAGTLCVMADVSLADETDDAPDAETARAPAEDAVLQDDADDTESFDALRRRLMDDLGVPPVVEPTRAQRVHTVPSRIGEPAASVDVDFETFVQASRRARVAFREGAFISNRPGQIVSIAPGKYVFLFEDDEHPDPMMLVLQPNQPLQVLEQQLEREGWETSVIASGQVHHYRNTSHLLLSFASYMDLEGPQVTFVDGRPVQIVEQQDEVGADESVAEEAAPEIDDRIGDDLDYVADAPVVSPTVEQADGGAHSQVALAQTRSHLQRGHLTDYDMHTAPDVKIEPAKREGAFMVLRQGRLIRSPHTGWPMFLLEADSTQEGHEPPLAVLPSRVLSQMEDAVTRLGQEQIFVVSGQIHRYQGKNYLMPTSMQPAQRRDNLKQ